MKLYNKKGHEIIELIKNKEIKVEEVVGNYLDRIEKLDNKINGYIYVAREESLDSAKKLDKRIQRGEEIKGLFGLPIGVKDNISVRGMVNTCGSKMLQNYIAPYDATVISKIKENNGIIIGKTNMDEFGMGSSGENSAFNLIKNPWNLNMVSGGSSGGSAASVALREVPFALGTETGGSVREPASFCGIVGLKPTYGRVSRYGVTAFASTLDQVGVFGGDVKDCAILTEVISGYDKKDSTTVKHRCEKYKDNLNKNLKGRKIVILKELFKYELDDTIRKSINEVIKILKENGAIIYECSMPILEQALSAYYIISSAEASSNLARFDGIRYGYRSENLDKNIDIYTKSRSDGFGEEVKKRIMLGTYMLSKDSYEKYYEKALKIRTIIKREFQEIFKEYDAIISPTTGSTAFKIGDKSNNSMDMYLSDIYTVPANLAGLPAISVPCGFKGGLPFGFQIISDYFREDILFNIAYSYEQSKGLHKIIPKL